MLKCPLKERNEVWKNRSNHHKFETYLWAQCYPVDSGRKLNVHKTFIRRPGRLLNVLYTFNLHPLSTVKPCQRHFFVIVGLMFHSNGYWSIDSACKSIGWFLYEWNTGFLCINILYPLPFCVNDLLTFNNKLFGLF